MCIFEIISDWIKSVERHAGFFNLIIGLLTLWVVAMYTCYTKQILSSMYAKDDKPILLRGGSMDFNTFPVVNVTLQNPVNLGNIKLQAVQNVATEITGWVVLSGFKYQLLFGNDQTVTQLQNNLNAPPHGTAPGATQLTQLGVNKKWGWIASGGWLICIADATTKTESDQRNQLIINYKSITGVKYRLFEDDAYEQTINPL